MHWFPHMMYRYLYNKPRKHKKKGINIRKFIGPNWDLIRKAHDMMNVHLNCCEALYKIEGRKDCFRERLGKYRILYYVDEIIHS